MWQTVVRSRTRWALSNGLLIFVSRPLLHRDLTTIQKIQNQKIHENSRKSWKFRKIKSESGVHEILTRGHWTEWGCHKMVSRRHWAGWEWSEVVTKGRRTGWLVVVYSYINLLKSLYFLNFFDFLELSCISSNFLKFLDFCWFSSFSWFFGFFFIFLTFQIFLISTNFLKFSWISCFCIFWIVVRSPWSAISSFWSPSERIKKGF